jgi:WYL_2, Sm-like SH3 beta-barrel fold
MAATHGGKGSTTRPTDKQKYNDNWDRIFGKKAIPLIGEKMNKVELLDVLHNNVVNITFTKVNGDVRILKGTLLDQYLPQKEVDPSGVEVETIVETQTRKATNDNVVVAWDIENDGYRSFRVDSVTTVEIIEN